MNQFDFLLQADTNIARRGDPDTSHLAAAQLTESGKRASRQAAVLSWVLGRPGHTAAEYAALVKRHGGDLPPETFHKRLPELAADHDKHGKQLNPKVRRGGKRVCNVTGNVAITWWPIGSI